MHVARRLIVLGLGFAMALAVASTAFAVPTKASGTTRAQTIEKKIDNLEKRRHELQGTLRFHTVNKKFRWMIHPNQLDKPCWEVKLSGPLKVCMAAREAVRESNKRLRKVEAGIEYLESLLLDVGNTSHWNCIHRYERHPSQGWATKTGNGYYGGLQMDLAFQRAHGLDLLLRKGTADNWTRLEQMMVAERAKKGIRTSLDEDGKVYLWQDEPRGYNPWPNTARYCGLIK